MKDCAAINPPAQNDGDIEAQSGEIHNRKLYYNFPDKSLGPTINIPTVSDCVHVCRELYGKLYIYDLKYRFNLEITIFLLSSAQSCPSDYIHSCLRTHFLQPHLPPHLLLLATISFLAFWYFCNTLGGGDSQSLPTFFDLLALDIDTLCP